MCWGLAVEAHVLKINCGSSCAVEVHVLRIGCEGSCIEDWLWRLMC